jgi:DNA-binding CsgD family transcriptional regulator
MIVDDLHWADAPSLRWLAQLARRLDELPLALLGAVRSGEPPGDPELIAELVAGGSRPPVVPRPLGPAATAVLVREHLPEATPTFAEACHAASGGNPFLLRALVTELAAEGVSPTDEAAATLSAYGPEQVARTVERQLARLPAGAAALAQALAMLDAPAPVRQAAALAGLDLAAATELADALHACGLVTGNGKLALAHPIVSAALYNSIPPAERGLWHARAARLLVREHADPERSALHLLHTEPAADAEAVSALLDAAAGATARGAPETAAGFLRRALAEPPPDRRTEAAVRLELGLALTANFRPGAAEQLLQAVELGDDPSVRVETAIRAFRALALASRFEEAFPIAHSALRDTSRVPDEAVARLEAELVACSYTQAATRQEALRRLQHPAAPRSALPLWHVNAAAEATFAGRPASEALDHFDAVLTSGALAAERDTILTTVGGMGLIWNEAFDKAYALSDGVVEAARSRGWISTAAHGSYVRGLARLGQADLRDAEADLRFAFEFKLTTGSSTFNLLFTLASFLDALVEGDRLDEADEVLGAVVLPEPLPEAIPAPIILQSRARLRLARGRPNDALADLREAALRWEALDIRHPGLADWRAHAAAALLELGEPAEARRLTEEQLELAERLQCPGVLSAALRVHSLTAERDERIALLERAVSVVAKSQAQLEHARALCELGAGLRRANRRAEARVPLRAALDISDRGGAARIARRADAELRAAGARPRRAALTGPDALTAAEHRVATLAAAGYTNREIAQQLFVSRRTVETHLAHAFQKLRISSREQLGEQLESARPAEPVPL